MNQINNTRGLLKPAKAEATRAKDALSRMGIQASHSQALEVAAAVHGHANWHAYRHGLLNPPSTGNSAPAFASQERIVKLFDVALYAFSPSERPGKLFIAKERVLATSEDAAREQVEEAHWDRRLEITGHAPTVHTEYLCDVVEPSNEALVEWLLGNVVDSSDLDDWVTDLASEMRMTEVNLTDLPDEQDSELSAAERAASEINNGGIPEQLEFLRKGHQHWDEFVTRLRGELGLLEFPSFD